MSQSLEQIENYFQGTLNAIEAREFEKAIQNDPDFAKEVAYYISSVGTVKDQLNAEKKIRFRQVYESSKMAVADQLAPSKSKGAVIRQIWKYAVAAAVISAVLVSGYLYTKSPTPQQMADTYISTELTNLGVSMSSVADSIEIGKRLNNDGKWEEALLMFEHILSSNPKNIKALEYAGSAALLTKNFDKALKYYGELSDVPGLISNPGQFYTALTLMKRDQPGDQAKAKEILQGVVRNNLAHREIAESWLKNW
jgi:tetratricopeptide (TPR) repeat protein